MNKICQECNKVFFLKWEWGADAWAYMFKVNPNLKLLCTRCGHMQLVKQVKRVDFQEDVRAIVSYNGFISWPEAREIVARLWRIAQPPAPASGA